jgi:hypothetical protein
MKDTIKVTIVFKEPKWRDHFKYQWAQLKFEDHPLYKGVTRWKKQWKVKHNPNPNTLISKRGRKPNKMFKDTIRV